MPIQYCLGLRIIENALINLCFRLNRDFYDAKDEKGNTPFWYAIKEEQFESARFLLSKDASKCCISYTYQYSVYNYEKGPYHAHNIIFSTVVQTQKNFFSKLFFF